MVEAPEEQIIADIKTAPSPPPYRLQIGDAIDIKVRLNPELNESVIIPPDGLISTTMAEDVQAYGRSVPELRKALASQYSNELKNPRISLIMRSFAPNRVYVAGEVNAPGEFVTAGPNLTMMQAIARAGGLKNSASESRIFIMRHNDDNSTIAYSTDYSSVSDGNKPAKDVKLAPYDVLVVPRSDVGNVYKYYQQFVQQFIPASFSGSYQINPQSQVTR